MPSHCFKVPAVALFMIASLALGSFMVPAAASAAISRHTLMRRAKPVSRVAAVTRDSVAVPAMVTDTLHFEPAEADTGGPEQRLERPRHAVEDEWLEAPFGDDLLTNLDRWRAGHKRVNDDDLIVDYNRVDQLRLGLHTEYGPLTGLRPRLGARFEYAFGRDRPLYGIQIEQPLVEDGRFGLGVSFARRTAHSELQQLQDVENSLALLFGRQDYRDYFEREGADAYDVKCQQA